jgi:alpha-galactosidase
MGLKIGIYSTPWMTSYAGFCGGSSNDPNGKWDQTLDTKASRNDGQYPMADHDAKQWAAWGIDYLKYDWNPRSNKTPDEKFHQQTATMANALVNSGRDIFYSYSNSMPFDAISDQSKLLNAWRTTGDIRDSWWSLTGIGFSQNKWAEFGGPGHWNDPDMLVVGYVGWGPKLHASNLTADEQFTHISLWSLLSAPMLIGCDLDRLDPFTISLLSNDEVIAIDQDALGKPATLVAKQGPEITVERTDRPNQPARKLDQGQVWMKELEDGGRAVGLFNVGNEEMKVSAKWSDLKVDGKQVVRDLWRQKDLGEFDGKYEATIAPHGVLLVRLSAVK